MPISSTQMSGLVGGQQAMFGNMATYAAQISPFAPQGMAPTYTNPMAGAEFPPSMGYVPGQTEYAEAGARAPGLIGGAAAYGAPALGMAGMAMGGRVGGMLDPFTGGMRGFGRGVGWQSGAGWGANLGRVMSGGVGGIARGIGMGAVGMLPGLAIGGAIQYAGGQMMEGAQFQNQAMGFMQNQFRFANPMARGGFGFGQQEMKNTASMLHEMGTSSIGSTPQEMLGIMQGTTSMGVYRGVRDAKEFQRKFKETVSALKEIAQTFNTTLAEAMPMFGEARRQGFWTPQDITRHAQQVRQVQATTGLSAQQAQQYTGAMAQTVQQIGGTLQQGSMLGSRALSMAGAATMGGWVSQQQLQNAGFGTGAEGTANFGMMMGSASARFAQSRVGRWTLAATMGQGGNLDPEQLAKLARGDLSVGDIQRMAERNVGGAGTTGRPGGAMTFVNNEEKLRGQMAEQGPAVTMGAVRTLTGGNLYGTGDREQLITRRIIQRYFGGDKRQADLMAEMARNMPRILAAQAAETEQQADAQQRQQQLGMQDTWQGVTRQIGQWWRENVTSPLQKMGADISTGLSRSWQRFSDKLWGSGGQYGLSAQAVRGYASSIESGNMGAMNRQFSTFGMGQQVAGGLASGQQLVGHEVTANMNALGIAPVDVGQRSWASTFQAKYNTEDLRRGDILSRASRGFIGEEEAKGLGYGGVGEMKSVAGGAAGQQMQAFLRSGEALAIRQQFGGGELKAGEQTEYMRKIVDRLREGAGGAAIQREVSGVSNQIAVVRGMMLQGEARGGYTGVSGLAGTGLEGLSGQAFEDKARSLTEEHAKVVELGFGERFSLAWGGGIKMGKTSLNATVAGLEEVRKHPRTGEALSIFAEAESLKDKDPKKAEQLRKQARAMMAEVANDKSSGISEEARAVAIRFSNGNDKQAEQLASIAALQGGIRAETAGMGFNQHVVTRMSRMRENLGKEGMNRLHEMEGKSEVARVVGRMMGTEGQDPEGRRKLQIELAAAAAKDPTGAAGVQGLLRGVEGASEMTVALESVAEHRGLAEKKLKGGDTQRLREYMGRMMGMQTSAEETRGLTTGKWGKGAEEKFRARLKEEMPNWSTDQVNEFMKDAHKGLSKGEVMDRSVRTSAAMGARTNAAGVETAKRFGVAAESATGGGNPLVEIAKNSAISRDYLRIVADNTSGIEDLKKSTRKKGKEEH